MTNHKQTKNLDDRILDMLVVQNNFDRKALGTDLYKEVIKYVAVSLSGILSKYNTARKKVLNVGNKELLSMSETIGYEITKKDLFNLVEFKENEDIESLKVQLFSCYSDLYFFIANKSKISLDGFHAEIRKAVSGTSLSKKNNYMNCAFVLGYRILFLNYENLERECSSLRERVWDLEEEISTMKADVFLEPTGLIEKERELEFAQIRLANLEQERIVKNPKTLVKTQNKRR